MFTELEIIVFALFSTGTALHLICRHLQFDGAGFVAFDDTFEEQERNHLCILTVVFGLLWFFRRAQRRGRELLQIQQAERNQGGRRGRGRHQHQEREEASHWHSRMVSTPVERITASSKTGSMPVACGMAQRPILPDWLVQPCRASVQKDKEQLCVLLSKRGNVEELSQYIEENGFNPSDYGLDVRSTLAFFQQHGNAISAKMNAALTRA